jgi:hypothetical protein
VTKRASSFDPPVANGLPDPATTPYDNWFCQRRYYNLSSTAYVYNDIFNQGFVRTESINSWYYAAYPLQIRWKAGDFDNIATLTGSPISSASSPPANSAPSSSPIAAVAPPTSTLSNGVIAAIVVVVGLILVAALAGLLWWLRKRSRERVASPKALHNQHASEMQGNSGKGLLPVAEVMGDAQYDHELEARERAELEARSREHRAELG